MVREDLRDLEHIRDISLVEHLVELLRTRSDRLCLSGASAKICRSTTRWLSGGSRPLENMYVCFRVSPYGPPKVRAVKKERKLYLWDWSAVAERGPRFENLVASHLLKYCHSQEDTLGLAIVSVARLLQEGGARFRRARQRGVIDVGDAIARF